MLFDKRNTAMTPGNQATDGIDVRHATSAIGRATSAELHNLIADVEHLLQKVANVADVDVAKLRDSVQERLIVAKSKLTDGGKQMTQTVRAAAGATDDYVRASPWQAMGVAAAVGAALGYLLAKR
jgi:ElaB/YqjD/DUF883 family membrane-anchored ribosome-binding protein